MAPYAGGAVFRASSFTADGVTGKTLNLIDLLNPAHTASQAVGANQPALPAPNPLLSGSNTVTLPFAGAQWLVSNMLASFWKKLHDGTGCTFQAVFVPPADVGGDRVIAATGDDVGVYSSTERGWYHQFRTGMQTGVFATNGPTGLPSPQRILTGAGNIATLDMTANVVTCTDYSFLFTGGTPQWTVRHRGAVILSGDTIGGNIPNAGDPASTLVIGADRSGGAAATMALHSLWFAPQPLTTPQRALWQKMITAETGCVFTA
jgi:hypothetical protein